MNGSYLQRNTAFLNRSRRPRQQPIPGDPMNLDRFLNFSTCGKDQWWPIKYEEWYERKNDHDLVHSDSTIANAIDSLLSLPSSAIGISKTPPYFSYK
ncbi:hypothetical protein PIB30_080080 [Stylosanthes scabra]|uniref:Uncharacterized protein n=1 Tax=Stylosanthes scabra TaxID=79078 RepID=A0ABU6SRK1_9FABA|nr:hypothetical protein [Stylosanthes scabra]